MSLIRYLEFMISNNLTLFAYTTASLIQILWSDRVTCVLMLLSTAPSLLKDRVLYRYNMVRFADGSRTLILDSVSEPPLFST